MSKDLKHIVDRLRVACSRPDPPYVTDPFELILFENVSYLVNDERRIKAFENLRRCVGLRPDEILSASDHQWHSVLELGGSNKQGQVDKMIRSAEIVMAAFDGDLSQVLSWPFKKAVGALKKFPSIGEPGAEKILLFCKAARVLPFDSNGLRVMVRIGFAHEQSNYTAMYKAAQTAVADGLPTDHDWLITAFQLLRHHGQTICKRSDPQCEMCVLRPECDFGRLL